MFKLLCSLKNRTGKCDNNICLTPASTRVWRGYKVHGLVRCKSKIQVVVSLGSLRVLFVPFLIYDR